MTDQKNVPALRNTDQKKWHGSENIERLVTLQPGTYWRCDTLPPQGTTRLETGLVYLLEKVKYVDQEPHAVRIVGHPFRSPNCCFEFLIDEFVDNFSFEPEGQAIRARELAEYQGKTMLLQEDFNKTTNDSNAVMQYLLEHPEHKEEINVEAGLPGQDATDSDNVGAMVRSDDPSAAIARIQAQVKNQALVAKARAEILTTKAKEIQEHVAGMQPFFKEQSAAALAITAEHVEVSKKMINGVNSLGLYVGDGVDFETLATGEGADASEPIHLLQRLLYLDEELAINILEGGADFSSLNEFAELLQSDTKLIERLIPFPRGVVAMKFRRSGTSAGSARCAWNQWEKDHCAKEDGPTLADAMRAAAEHEANQEGFLLIRNGANVYRVYSELVTKNTPRLFPTQAEMEECFRFCGQKVTMQSTRFADHRDRHDSKAEHYRKMVLLLWGLHDMKKAFGALPLDGQLNFLKPEVQQQIFRFIYDDESNLLSDGRPSWHEYLKAQNALMQPGSRVLIVWPQIMDPDTAPGALYAREWGRGDREVCWKADTELIEPHYGVTTVTYSEKEGRIVKARCKRTIKKRSRWGDVERYEDQNVDVKVFLDRYRGHNFAYLCLDAVKAEDLSYYLNSREDRQHYLDYVMCFSAAREHLASEAEKEAPFKAALVEALKAGAIVPAGTDPTPQIDDAVRTWRAAQRGAQLPAPGEPEYQRAFQSICNALFVLFGHGRDRASELADMMAVEGRQPLRLVVTGKGKLVLYATATKEEMIPQLFGHPWVQRLVCVEKKRGISIAERSWTVLQSSVASETVTREWPEAAEWTTKTSPGELGYEKAREIFDDCAAAPKLLREVFGRKNDDDWSCAFDDFKQATLWENENSGYRTFAVPTYIIPMALARLVPKPDCTEYEVERVRKMYNYQVYALQAPADLVLWMNATEAQRGEMATFLEGVASSKRTPWQDPERRTGFDASDLESFGTLGRFEIGTKGRLPEFHGLWCDDQLSRAMLEKFQGDGDLVKQYQSWNGVLSSCWQILAGVTPAELHAIIGFEPAQ